MVVNTTVAGLTARGLFGRRRSLVLLPLPLVLLLFAVVLRVSGVDPQTWAGGLVVGLGLAVLLPITALIVGTGVLGSEIDDGTIVHLLTKPLSRTEIVLSKLLVAAGITAVTAAVPLFLTALVIGSPRLGFALIVGTALGAVAYSAVFLLISLVARRAVLVGLVYVLVWEGLFGNYVAGTRVLSIEQYVGTVADAIAPAAYLPSTVSMPVVLIMATIITAGSTAWAISRLRSFSVTGETS